MAYSLSRMTVYALLSGLEEDLRIAIKGRLGGEDYSDDRFDQQLISRSKARLEKEIGAQYEESTLDNLVDYFDLGDTYQIINSNQLSFDTDFSQAIKTRTKQFEKIIPIRNRVMHVRPLNFDDLPLISDFCSDLISNSFYSWDNLEETFKRLHDDPSFVLDLKIPVIDSDKDKIPHNLPLPDFDETGLIGRDALVKQVKKLCLGGFPVISIVGEGGVGKSALALKVAYELLEEEVNPFDAVVWVTSKTTQITVNEIRDIKGAITSSIGVLQEISSQLSGIDSGDPLAEIIEYLGTFKIALFIDNLETIMDQNIHKFVSSLPDGSKLIITSRIGLGAYEYPIKLGGIEENYAAKLIRTLGQLRNVSSIATQDEATLRRYANRMYLNPGYIKWFVSAIQTGVAAEAVLQNSSLFLEFCMSNVYQFLSQDTRDLTTTMQCAPGWKDIAELSYLSGFEAIRIQKALQELMTTNMLAESSKPTGGSVKTTYQLAELARAYLNKHHRPSNAFQQKVKGNRNKLNSVVEMRSATNGNRYSPLNIKVRSKADRVIVKMLHDAMRHLRVAANEPAYEILEEAKRLAPDYFEVPRVLAYFHQKNGNYPEARESHELAIALAPNTAQLHYWFGKFILHEEESVDEAVDQFEIARKLDITSPEIAISLSRGYMFQHKFNEVRALIDELSEKIELLDDTLRKTYYDTRVQLNYREADFACQAGDIGGSINAIKKMREEFDHLPPEHKDTYMRSKLGKAVITVQRLLRMTSGTDDHAYIVDLLDWINHESEKSITRPKPRRL
ncbi:NB-ARC domain-containing protein [Pseudomonas sp. A214]|uniref:NB-ARC domain-containing protein n=1 Tax=Pseudomonas sp. A214 TaxID=1855331 RepID=UPI000953785A|nr:NB-ARC domain-containing protein [Pseudomonas sp. A214]SIS09786.1 NB-ARC domain-containing protein [Pseudomonas sp. A214]